MSEKLTGEQKMEQQKIGKFIHDLRKEMELTQKQLADKVGVSDKTISKWETGRGIPDTAIMNELCQVLGISINELLSGERLSIDKYNGKAEENMVNLLRDSEQEKEKQKWSKVNIVLNLLWILLLGVMIFIIGFSIGPSNLVYFFDIPSLYLTIGFLILCLGISGQLKFFWLGLKTACAKNDSKIEEKGRLEKAEYALDFGIKCLLLSCTATSLTSLVVILIRIDEPSALGPNLAVMILNVLYGVIFSMIIKVLKARVHNLIGE